MHLSQELLMNVQSSGDSRSFAKELKAFKMRSIVASHQKLAVTIERIIQANPLTTTREVANELNPDPSSVIQHLKQIGKVSGCLMSWLKI